MGALILRVKEALRPVRRRVNLLKMDVEGAEYAALEDMLASEVPVTQVLVEFHHRIGDAETLRRTRTAVSAMPDHRYDIVHITPGGKEYTFLRSGRR